MYFRLKDNISLRSWERVRGAVYHKEMPYATGVTAGELQILIMSDGEHDIEETEITDNLIKKGLIEPCEKGEHPSEWSSYKSYDNRYFPKMNLMITGKCNYNCLHCFNAADNAPLMTEWKFDELTDLLDQARDCGIHAFTITGGEPMLHPRFMDIIREIYKRDMFVEELNTNGYFLSQEKLDEMKETGCRPCIKISFDGIGHHDWLRNHKGAEKRTLDAMELCIKNGCSVISQTQVHRRNLECLLPTAKLLNDIGVDMMRLIRTTDVPRWHENAPDSCLEIEEYYGRMLEFMSEYKDSGLNMDIIIWQFMRAYPKSRSYHLDPVLCASGNYKDSDPICKGNRGMIAVTSNGEVVPCMQMSGYFKEKNLHLGNLHDTPLKELLSGGAYLDSVCADLHKRLEYSKKCAECDYYKYCNGGCPALAILYTGSMLGADPAKCLFFEKGWYEKSVKVMEGWRNTTEINKAEPS